MTSNDSTLLLLYDSVKILFYLVVDMIIPQIVK